jgi:hypothetical protein
MSKLRRGGNDSSGSAVLEGTLVVVPPNGNLGNSPGRRFHRRSPGERVPAGPTPALAEDVSTGPDSLWTFGLV